MSWLTEGRKCWLVKTTKQLVCVLVVGWHWHDPHFCICVIQVPVSWFTERENVG